MTDQARMDVKADEVFTVERWSGRNTDRARTVFSGPQEKATAKYEAIARDLRQGKVSLLAEDGSVIHAASAPRLRTRW